MDEFSAFVAAVAKASDFLDGRLSILYATFFGFTSRISAFQLALAVPFAAFVWRRSGGKQTGSFLAYLAPSSAYLSRDFLVDAKIFLFNAIFSPARRLLFGLSIGAAAITVASFLRQNVGQLTTPLPNNWASLALLAALLFTLTDFITYLVHRLFHQSKWLWPFHRVHHSARHLTPLTLMRKHPVYDLVGSLLDLSLRGPAFGLVIYFWEPGTGAAVAMLVTVIYGLFGALAGNLRHSHIWLSFGPLSRLIVSPAMHQIHHSTAPQHWNRNYGEVLAIWDVLLGTVYLPQHEEKLEFGCAEAPLIHPSWTSAMLEPFASLGEALSPVSSQARQDVPKTGY